MTNIMRHTHASSARLALHEESDGLALEMSDNGRGIAERAYVNPTTLGLRGMQERVRCSAAHFTSMVIRKRGRLSRRVYPSGANMSKTTPYQPCSILVGDDHAVVRRGLRHVIAEECDGAVFDEALTGQGVLDAVQRQNWAVVILDINLPDKTGLEVLKDLKAMRPALPVLILSHYAEAEYAVNALRAGAGERIGGAGCSIKCWPAGDTSVRRLPSSWPDIWPGSVVLLKRLTSLQYQIDSMRPVPIFISTNHSASNGGGHSPRSGMEVGIQF